MRRQVKKCYTALRRSAERIQKKLNYIHEMATDEFNLLVPPDLVIENAQSLEEDVTKIADQLAVMRAALTQVKDDMEKQIARDSAMYDYPSPPVEQSPAEAKTSTQNAEP